MSTTGGRVGYVLIALFAAAFLFFIYDILFSEPDHRQGTVIEKIHVPARNVTAPTPYGGSRRGNYFIITQKVDQYIAVVKMQDSAIVVVHCLPDHFERKKIGDQIHFKKYEGKHLHIQYFAHNEEED